MTIRNIARDMQSQYITDEKGEQITFEEWQYRNKYINFKGFQWPQENPIDIKSSLGDGVELANYRFPVPEGIKTKGIVYFVHGYGCSVANHAYLAQMFAEQGYEFCGMDQRGFGKSGGT